LPPAPAFLGWPWWLFFLEIFMQTPAYRAVSTLVATFNTILREEFEERAGIIEFDGKLPRATAECLAILDVLKRHPSVLTGVIALQVRLDGAEHCVLTTDLDFAHRRLATLGATEIGTLDLRSVVAQQLGGLALLVAVR